MLCTSFTAPAKLLNVTVTADEESPDMVEVECYAEGVYPEPQLKLLKGGVGLSEYELFPIGLIAVSLERLLVSDLKCQDPFKLSKKRSAKKTWTN